MELRLEGKTALVTGSSAGIGVGIASMLAAEGAMVVVHGRNIERAQGVAAKIRQQGGRCAVVCGDLANRAGVDQVAETVLEVSGGIDILVNNAGGSPETADPGWFFTGTDTWLETYQANVLAAMCLVQALVPAMRERGWGRVINISTAAAITPTSAQPDYAAAKAAMLNMSLSLSKALSGTGVTSNAISPGMIRTAGLNTFLANFATKRGWDNDLARAEAYVLKGAGQTVAKVGEVEDIAYAVAMLASPRSDFINGTNMHVDGGISPSLY
ncbi:MAG TPA: SDR family NAD(P)-dependent oxidoreductase [Pseudomonas xinjiangensis]|uniref:SDR family NAD(P)-dependent oxidoreductase n=2 Tax=root TaxID=1 RepID=A0A7V1FTJ8_9GAMM|nr:SDR family NAD(P)-dependent oxidoreductase [Halopseudomonas xinjiangensis]HEC47366.1 SDR family NAD(P)-dependent oxidoreductase [Halopseudomonas xinjiangensis]